MTSTTSTSPNTGPVKVSAAVAAMPALNDVSVQALCDLAPDAVVRAAWPTTPLSVRRALWSRAAHDVGGPVRFFSGETCATAATTISAAAAEQVKRLKDFPTVHRMRGELLKTHIFDVVAQHAAQSSMLKSGAAGVKAPAVAQRSARGANRAQNSSSSASSGSGGKKSLFGSDGALRADWAEHCTRINPPELVDAIRSAAVSASADDAVVLACGVCAIAGATKAHHASAVEALDAVVPAVLARPDDAGPPPEAVVRRARALLHGMAAVRFRPQECRKVSDIIKEIEHYAVRAAMSLEADQQEAAAATATNSSTICFDERFDIVAGPEAEPDAGPVDEDDVACVPLSDKWAVQLDIPYATEFSINVVSLDGDVSGATLIAPDGTVSEVSFNALHAPTVPGGGMLLLHGGKNAALRAAVVCKCALPLPGSATAELKEALATALLRAVSVLLEQRPSNTGPIGDVLPVLRGGLTDAASPRPPPPGLDAACARVRCRKKVLAAVRSFCAAALALTGDAPEAVNRIVAAAQLHGEVMGCWNSEQLQAVDVIAAHAVPCSAVPTAVETVCDAILHAVPKLSAAAIRDAVKERWTAAQRGCLALDLLKHATSLLPHEQLCRLHRPLQAFFDDGTFAAWSAGCGDELQARLVEKLRGALDLVLRLVRRLHDADASARRPHHYIRSERGYASFALVAMALAVAPRPKDVPQLVPEGVVVDTLLSFVAPPNDMARTASYRVDATMADSSGSDADDDGVKHLTRLAQGVAFHPDTGNEFSKSGTVNFSSDALARGHTDWALGASTLQMFTATWTGGGGGPPVAFGVAARSVADTVKSVHVGSSAGAAFYTSTGAVLFGTVDGVCCRCDMPKLAVNDTVSVALQTVRGSEHAVLFFVNNELRCRVPLVATDATAVPLILSVKGCDNVLTTSFGATPDAPLRAVMSGSGVHPTPLVMSLAAARTLFAIAHAAPPNSDVAAQLLERLVEGAETLVDALEASSGSTPAGDATLAAKAHAVRWLGGAMLEAYMACARPLLTSGDAHSLTAALGVFQRIIQHGEREAAEASSAGSNELMVAALAAVDELIRAAPAQLNVGAAQLRQLTETLARVAQPATLAATPNGYAPRWDPTHMAPTMGVRDGGSELCFNDRAAEHCAAFATPAVPTTATASCFTVCVTRESGAADLGPFNFVGVGDIKTSSRPFLSDYVRALSDSKKHMYVLPAMQSDFGRVSSLNAEELKRHKPNWADATHVYQCGDRISIVINAQKRTVAFTRNGLPLGTLFSNVATTAPLHPVVCLYASDSVCSVDGVTTSGLPPASSLRALALLQTLAAHPSTSPVTAEWIDSRLRTDVLAMQVLGSDGAALACAVMPSGKLVKLVGGGGPGPRGAIADGLVVEPSSPQQALRSVPWAALSPHFGNADADAAARLTPARVAALAASMAEYVATDAAAEEVTVLSPGYSLRAARLISEADFSDLSAAQLESMLKVFSPCVVQPKFDHEAANATATVDAAWHQLRALQAEYLTLRTGSAVDAAAELPYYGLVDGKCYRCGAPWISAACADGERHPTPLSTAEAVHLLKHRGAGDAAPPFTLAGTWTAGSPAGEFAMTLSFDGNAASGTGGCAIGDFDVSGVLVSRTQLRLRVAMRHRPPPAESDDEDDANAEWACEVCTFLNAPTDSRCGMCNSGRAGANWACPACTYAFNANDVAVCGMCGTSRVRDRSNDRQPVAVSAMCEGCSATAEVTNIMEFRRRAPCSRCSAMTSWALTTAVVGTFTGTLDDQGSSIAGTMSIRNHTIEMTFGSAELMLLAREAPQCGTYLRPPPRPVPYETATRDSTAASPPRGDGAVIRAFAYFAKRIVLQALRALGRRDALLTYRLVAAAGDKAELRALIAECDAATCRHLISIAVDSALIRDVRGASPHAGDAVDAALRIAAATVEHAESSDTSQAALPPETVNSLLYALVVTASLAQRPFARRRAVTTITTLLSAATCGNGAVCSRLLLDESTVAVAAAPAVLQAMHGGPLPNHDADLTAAALVLASVARMRGQTRLHAVLDRDLSSGLGHWIQLAQTTITPTGALVCGQLQGSAPARRSAKDKYYYEVEAPKNMRGHDMRMGWGTVNHARNSATYHVGNDGHSWAYNLKNLVTCFGGESEYQPPFHVQPGDVVGSLLDLENGTCAWSINGFVMQPISVEGLVEDDEIYPFVSAAVREDAPLPVRLSNTRYLPAGFKEFTNMLPTVAEQPSTVAPQAYDFYTALNSLVDELCSAGFSFEQLVARDGAGSSATTTPPLTAAASSDDVSPGAAAAAASTASDDGALQRQLGLLVPVFPAVHAIVKPHSIEVWLAVLQPYLRHLVAVSDLSSIASNVYPQLASVPQLHTVAQQVRYLVVLPARWGIIESTVQRRVQRNTNNIFKVTIDRARAARAYAKPVATEKETDTILAQFYAQTYQKELFSHLVMAAVAFKGSIAEDRGGLYRSCLTMIADEVMQRAMSGDNAADVEEVPPPPPPPPMLRGRGAGGPPSAGRGRRGGSAAASRAPSQQASPAPTGEAAFPGAAAAAGADAVRRTMLFVKNQHSTYFNAVPNVHATSPDAMSMYTWFGKLLANITLTGSVVFAVDFPRLFWRYLLGEAITIDHYFHDCCDTVRTSLQDDAFLLDDELFFDAIPDARKYLAPAETSAAPGAAAGLGMAARAVSSADLGQIATPTSDPDRDAQRTALVAARRRAAEQALVHMYDTQLQAIRAGFSEVMPAEGLSEMTWVDLQRRVCGASTFGAAELLSWFDTTLLDEPTLQTLAECIEAMTPDQRSRLLLFSSGQTRLPLPEKVKVVCGDEPDKFPTAHTCSPITMTVQPYGDAAAFLSKFLVSMAHAYEYAFV